MEPNSLPWMVHLKSIIPMGYSASISECGGAIIDERTILTAAHCVADSSARNMRVQVGSHNKWRSDAYGVEKITVSRHYDYEEDPLNYDIALLRLSRPLKFSPKVQPICIQAEDTIDLPNLLVAGWGYLNGDLNKKETDTLRKVNVDYVKRKY